MKISKKLLFTSAELLNYLKTVKKFDKVDEEILATITYKRVYERLEKKSTLVAFPYRQNKEEEINNRPFLTAEKIGEFIKKYAEQDSPIDSILVDPRDEKNALIRPLQIKFLGKGKYKNVTSEKFIDFLKQCNHFQKSKISLIIVLDGHVEITRLEDVKEWLKTNDFPFEEVVLINPNNVTGDMEFYQLKPSAEILESIKISKDEMMNEL